MPRLPYCQPQVGSGKGFTYPNQVPPLPGFLIQHVLRIGYLWASAEWQPLAASVGEDIGSDHPPVVAQLALVAGSLPNDTLTLGPITTLVDSDAAAP